MAKSRSKRYSKAMENVPTEPLPLDKAVDALKSIAKTKFDATVELVMHLGIDPKQADQALRGSISLPNGIGSTRKVIAFCEDSEIEAAKAAGASEAGSAELVEMIQGGWMDFDVAVATPAVMRDIAKLGRVLGPQGKMPSPKAGTVGPDITKMVTEYSAGKVEYRNDDGGNLHVPVGKISFEVEKLIENIEYFLAHVKRIRPSATKGIYIKKACLSATMSPSVHLDLA